MTGKEEADFIKNLESKLNILSKKSKGFHDQVTEATAKQLNGHREMIKKLEAEVAQMDKLKDKGKEILKNIKEQSKAYQAQFQVTGRIVTQFNALTNNFILFMRTTAAQYNLAEKIAKEYKTVARDIGLGGEAAANMTKSFKEALPNILQMGISAEDTRRIYTEMADASGRITPISPEDAERIAGIAGATGMMADATTKMAEGFRLMGVESEAMEKLVFETYKQAQTLGLNANKVIKVLANNMKSMQEYSFAGGVKGMTEMAKQSVKMRLDVSDVLAMADKFYQPEAAIEAAANLQMLGGDIADAFEDPFETMYLARNKPEELAKKLGDMTENMMTFNNETGQYEFPAEVRMQLQAAGKELNINTDKMIEMARQTSKIKDIKMKFTSIGDDETRENLASLAHWSDEKGKFVVEHKGDELGLDQISDGMADEIMQANQTDEENIKDIAVNTQVMSEKLKSMDESLRAEVSTVTDMYEITAGEIEKTMIGPWKKKMNTAMDVFVENVGGELEGMITNSGMADQLDTEGLNKFTDALKHPVDSLEQFGDKLRVVLDDMDAYFEDTLDKTDEELIDEDITGITEEDDDMVSLPGGKRYFSGAKGTVKINDDDIVVAGTSLLGKETGSNVSGSIDINFNNAVIRLESNDGSVALDMNKIKDAIQPIIINALNNKSRNGGVLSSKEAIDNGLTV